MRVVTNGAWRGRGKRVSVAIGLVLAMFCASLASVGLLARVAEARGPAYDGEVTQSTGPAYFGPAPNPYPYCDSPTYFDPFPENVSPIGRMDIGETASVTTDGITMDLTITSEGNPGTQYPGFFDQGGDGSPTDQPKGIELAEGDGATVDLSEPLFYSQWIFTDVDQPNEGFTVTPKWTQVGQAAAFGGDNQFTFAGTTALAVELDDIDGDGHPSESIDGRVQVDFLGAVTGIDMLRTDPSNGQSGFAVGGGCEAAGAAKALVAGPTWNGTSYDVTYDLRVRNNLPSSATIQAVIDDAISAVGASFVTSTPQGIDLTNLQLTDDLTDPAFSSIEVTSISSNGALTVNDNFNGITDTNLIVSGAVAAESDELITISVEYTPDLSTANWDDCVAGYDLLNQSTVTGEAAGVAVADVSDNGVDAAPSADNGEGGVDDPTPVNFDCPPGELEIVKTVLPGPGATCPAFDDGIAGDGPALPVTVDDVATYCISARNIGPGPVFDVTISDPQAPADATAVELRAGDTLDTSYDVTVAASTPPVNTATATATDSSGTVGPVSDTAVIEPTAKPLPVLEIVKTVLPGANATCPDFDGGVAGLGPALQVDDQDTVTYCITVRNTGPGDATSIVISDPQAPQDYNIGTLTTGQSATESYDLTVGLTTPTVNTATGAFNGPDGPLPAVTDDAQIAVAPLEPDLEIVKTVLAGAGAVCPAFAGGTPGIGAALVIDDRTDVTYCVTVINNGPGVATDVVVTDPQAPAGSFAIGTLNAGAEETVSFSITATLTTPQINTATATANGPNGALAPIDDQAQISVDALPDPGLQIVKTALVGPGAQCSDFAGGTPGLGAPVQFLEGDTVTYCVTVRNAGPGPAFDVVLTDDQAPNTFDLVIGDLAVGEEVTRSYDVANLQVGDPTVTTAAANGTGLNGALPEVSDPAQIAISLQPDPVLEIVKTVLAGPDANCPAFAAGVPGDGPAFPALFDDVVTFCISVRNTGGNDASSVQVSDAQAPGLLQLGTIPVGEERTAQYDVTVSANTPVQNTATAVGQGPNGQVGPVSDTALIDPDAQPDPVLEIVKTVVGPGESCPVDFAGGTPGDGDALIVEYGSDITYCVTVRNVGQRAATNVVVTDVLAAGPISLGDLPVGGELNTSYVVTGVDASTPENTEATAVGQGPNGQVGPVSDTAPIAPASAVIAVVKTAVAGPDGTCPAFDDGVVGLGTPLPRLYDDVVTYCLTVKNVGGNAASDVTVSDDQAPQVYTVASLAPDAEATFSYDITVTAQTPLENVASATGTGPDGSPIPTVEDPAAISTNAQPDPVLEIVKTVVGPGESCPVDFAGGTPGDGDALIVEYGTDITYCVTVRNVGQRAATNVVVTDVLAAGPISLGDLPVGGELNTSYVVAGVDASTPENTEATAVGQGPNGQVGPVSDTAPIAPDAAVLAIVKTAVVGPQGACPAFDDGVVGEGDALSRLYTQVVTYCLTVKNTGGNAASDVVISDAQASQSYDIGNLAPGAEVTRSFDITVTESTPLVNIATAAGNGPGGDPVPTVEDPAVITTSPLPDPVLEIVKTVVAGPNGTCPAFADGIAGDGPTLPVNLNEFVTYCISIENSGAGDATDVQISDDQSPDTPYIIGDLASGQGVDRQFDAQVGLNTALKNTAVVSGTGPNSDPGGLSATDTAVIDVVDTRIANVSLVHSVAKGDDECVTEAKNLNSLAADRQDLPVTWCALITNLGNVHLTNILLSADDISDDPIDVLALEGLTTLAPEESIYIIVEGVIPEAGLISRAGVSADASDPEGNLLPGIDEQQDFDNANVLEASIDIESTVIAGSGGNCDDAVEVVEVVPGEDVTWCYEVTNSGNTVLRVAEVTDSVLGISIPVPAVDQRLGLGDTFVVSISLPVAESEITNNGDVAGQPLGFDDEPLLAPEVVDQDDASIVISQANLSIVKGVSNNGPVPAGSLLTYTLVVSNAGPSEARDVKVTDALPGGLAYNSVPSLDGWVCALDSGRRGFTCLKSTAMAADESVTLTYTVAASGGTPFVGVGLTNTATVTSTTPDPDPSDNTDTETTSILRTPSQPPLPPIGPEIVPPAPPLAPPDEVLGLVVTGAASRLLGLLATAMLALGGMFTVGARRGRDDY